MEEDQEHGGEPPVQDPGTQPPTQALAPAAARRGLRARSAGSSRGSTGAPAASASPAGLTCVQSHKRRTACTGIRLHFLPRGMTTREHNRSRHNYRKDCIYWTLEWRFNSTDVVLTDHEIDEHTNLLSLLEKHLSPSPWKDQLTPYRNTELRDLKLFIQKSAKESESSYSQLNIEEPLGP